MPPVIAAGLIAATTVGGTSVLAGTVLGVSYAAIISQAVWIGGLLAAQYVLKGKSKEEQREPYQTAVAQAAGPRLRAYGAVRTGGVIYLFEAAGPTCALGVAMISGRIKEFQELIIDGVGVTTGLPSVLSGSVGGSRFTGYCDATFHLGAHDQARPTAFDGVWGPGIWGSDHQLKGIAGVQLRFYRPAAVDVPKIFPSGVPTSVRTTLLGALVWDPRTDPSHGEPNTLTDEFYNANWDWSDNPALCLLDYLRHPDGMRRPLDWIDLPSFIAAADDCDQLIGVSGAPGAPTEKRYRCWGIYFFDEPARDVIARILATCDGQMYRTPDGKIAMRVGKARTPSITITKDHIIRATYTEGAGRLAEFNEIRTRWTSPTKDFQLVEGPKYTDLDAIAQADGIVRSTEIALSMVPSRTQAFRLAVRFGRRQAFKRKLTLVLNFYGLMLFGEAVAYVDWPEMGMDNAIFQIMSIDPSEDFASFEVTMQEVPANTFDDIYPLYDDGGVPEDPDEEEVEDVVDLVVSVGFRTAGGASIPFLKALVDAPTDTSLALEAQYRAQGTSTWVGYDTLDVGLVDPREAHSGPVSTGATYETRARFAAPGGATGDWTTPVTETFIDTEETPLNDASAFSVTFVGSNTRLTWTNPSSAYLDEIEVLRNTVDILGTASVINTIASPVSGAVTTYNDSPGTGQRFYWIRAVHAIDPLLNSETSSRQRLSDEYMVLRDRFTGTPSVAQEIAQDTLMRGLVASSAWGNFDGFYVFAVHDEQASTQNWRRDTFNITKAGTVTFTADRGITGDATTGSYNTGFNPTTAVTPEFTLNQAHIGLEVRTAQNVGSSGSTNTRIAISPAGGVTTRLNDATSSSVGAGASTGHIVASRAAAGSYSVYREGALLGTHSVTSTSITNAQLSFLSLGGSSNFTAAQLVAGHFGGELTTGDVEAIETLLDAYRTAVGA